MHHLKVSAEIKGNFVHIGDLTGETTADSVFVYDKNYLAAPESRPVSISLPLKESPFTPEETRNYFEGLLPEGFSRQCVARTLKTPENDYLSILSGLGRECIGAVRIEEDGQPAPEAAYRELTSEEVSAFAAEGAAKSAELVTKAHLSLTGASGKAGMYYDEKSQKWYLPLGTAPSTHIVKQSHIRLKNIVANEMLCLLTAAKLGIETPESFIIDGSGNGTEEVLFATKRYDRIIPENCSFINGMPVPLRLHQEDFAQALGIAADDKYEKNNDGYLKKSFELLRKYSADPIEDSLKLWDICIFSYLIGNTDNHIKNLSLLYSEDLHACRLAPAYDIVSTIIYESCTEQMAVSIGGEYNIRFISEKHFAAEAENIGLGPGLAMKRFDKIKSSFKPALLEAKNELETARPYLKLDEICRQILSLH